MANLETMFLENFNQGKTFFDRGQYQEALTYLQRAYRIKPEDEQVLNILGMTYFRLERLEEAEEIYETLARKNPNVPVLHSNLGLIRLKKGDLEGAELAFSRVLQLQPENKKIHAYLGLISEQRGDLDAAIEHYERAGAIKKMETLQERRREKEAEAMDEALILEAVPIGAQVEQAEPRAPRGTTAVPMEDTTPRVRTEPTVADMSGELAFDTSGGTKPIPSEEFLTPTGPKPAEEVRDFEILSTDETPRVSVPSEEEKPAAAAAESKMTYDMTVMVPGHEREAPAEEEEAGPETAKVEREEEAVPISEQETMWVQEEGPAAAAHVETDQQATTVPRPEEMSTIAMPGGVPPEQVPEAIPMEEATEEVSAGLRPVNLGLYAREQLYIHPPAGSERFLLLEPYLLEVVLSDRVLFRENAMVAYNGHLVFDAMPVTEQVNLILARGLGILFLSYQRYTIHLISLNEERVFIALQNFLVAQAGLNITPHQIQESDQRSFHYLEIAGTGTVGFVLRSKPLDIKVLRSLPAVVNSDAIVVWSGDLQVEPVVAEHIQGLVRAYNKQAVPLQFEGLGDIIVEQGALWGERRLARDR